MEAEFTVLITIPSNNITDVVSETILFAERTILAPFIQEQTRSFTFPVLQIFFTIFIRLLKAIPFVSILSVPKEFRSSTLFSTVIIASYAI